MRVGTIISGVGHGGLILWLLFGGALRSSPPDPVDVADVSIVSGAEFAALNEAAAPQAADPAPEPPAPEPPAPAPEPPVPEPPEPAPAPPPEPAPDPMPDPVPEPEPAPQPVPAPPTPPSPDAVDDTPVPDVAPPRPAPRVAPEAAPAPPPDATPDPEPVEQVTPDPTDAPAPDVVETPPSAPQEAATQIVTEAEEREESGLAPPTSSRPVARPSTLRPPREPAPTVAAPAPEPAPAPTPDPAPQESQQAAIDDALRAAIGGSDTGGVGSAPSGPPMTSGEKDALRLAVGKCWNVGSLSTEALGTTVVLRVSMAEDGTPQTASIRLESFSGGGETAARQTFESARRAVIRCGASGYDLPKSKYAQWRDIEMTFNPENMRIK